jgi:hypothetical protein
VFLRQERHAWYADDVKRRVRTIAVYLVLGSMLNVSVALALALTAGYQRHSARYIHNPRGGFPGVLVVNDRLGHQIVQGVPRGGTLLAIGQTSVAPFQARVWWPADAVAIHHPEPFAVAVGWPFLSFHGWRSYVSENLAGPGDPGVLTTAINHHAVMCESRRLKRPSGPFSYSADLPILVPFAPLGSGIAASTLFYGGVVCSLAAAWRCARALIRSRRGLCARCAYPRENHIVCPECGTTHKPRMSEPVAHALPPA